MEGSRKSEWSLWRDVKWGGEILSAFFAILCKTLCCCKAHVFTVPPSLPSCCCCCCCLVAQSCGNLFQSMDCSPPGSCIPPGSMDTPWDLPSKNTGVGCNILLRGIFLTQWLNLYLLHWHVDSLLLSHQGSLYANTQIRKYSYCFSNKIGILLYMLAYDEYFLISINIFKMWFLVSINFILG